MLAGVGVSVYELLPHSIVTAVGPAHVAGRSERLHGSVRADLVTDGAPCCDESGRGTLRAEYIVPRKPSILVDSGGEAVGIRSLNRMGIRTAAKE